jgi:hypothetical protein
MDKVKVLLGSAVTWLVAAGSVVAIVVSELEPFRDVPAVGAVLNVLAAVGVVAGVAASIVRRVTPVLPSARGLTPPASRQVVTDRERTLALEVQRLHAMLPGQDPRR